MIAPELVTVIKGNISFDWTHRVHESARRREPCRGPHHGLTPGVLCCEYIVPFCVRDKAGGATLKTPLI